jgi:hypothetical protein
MKTNRTVWQIVRKPVKEENLRAQLKYFVSELIKEEWPLYCYSKDFLSALVSRPNEYNIETQNQECTGHL